MNPMDPKFFDTFACLIHGKKQEFIKTLASGVIKSYDEYKYLAGKIFGLQLTLDMLSELGSGYYGKKLVVTDGKVYVDS